MDAPTYNKHFSPQKRDAEIFFKESAAFLEWDGDDAGTMMDVGCGTGVNSTRLLLDYFPKARKVVGIDVLDSMIALARQQVKDSRAEFAVYSVQDRSLGSAYRDQVDKVLSLYVLHFPSDKEATFANIFEVLKPGGEAATCTVIESCMEKGVDDIDRHPAWEERFRDIRTRFPENVVVLEHDGGRYRRIAESVGFEIILCEEQNMTFDFDSYDDFKGFTAALCSYSQHIPKELREDYDELLAQAVLKHCRITRDGKPQHPYRLLNLLLRKPKAE